MGKNLIIRDAFPGWAVGRGLFELFNNPPWYEEISPTSLNLEYFGNHSGSKLVTPLVHFMVDEDSGHLSDDARESIATLIYDKFKHNWERLWDSNVVEYSPIHNYDMTEDRNLTVDVDNTTTTDGTLVKTGGETTNYGKSETVTHGRTSDDINYKYGINTEDDPKPSDKSEMREGGTTQTTDSGSDSHTRNLTDKNDVSEIFDSDTVEHENTRRYGNIGVTTTQKILSEEREVWKWNFFEQVYKDIDTILALEFYDVKASCGMGIERGTSPTYNEFYRLEDRVEEVEEAVESIPPDLSDIVSEHTEQLNTLYFDQDDDGNWGYKVGGAGTVTPFRRGGNIFTNTSQIEARIEDVSEFTKLYDTSIPYGSYGSKLSSSLGITDESILTQRQSQGWAAAGSSYYDQENKIGAYAGYDFGSELYVTKVKFWLGRYSGQNANLIATVEYLDSLGNWNEIEDLTITVPLSYPNNIFTVDVGMDVFGIRWIHKKQPQKYASNNIVFFGMTVYSIETFENPVFLTSSRGLVALPEGYDGYGPLFII